VKNHGLIGIWQGPDGTGIGSRSPRMTAGIRPVQKQRVSRQDSDIPHQFGVRLLGSFWTTEGDWQRQEHLGRWKQHAAPSDVGGVQHATKWPAGILWPGGVVVRQGLQNPMCLIQNQKEKKRRALCRSGFTDMEALVSDLWARDHHEAIRVDRQGEWQDRQRAKAIHPTERLGEPSCLAGG